MYLPTDSEGIFRSCYAGVAFLCCIYLSGTLYKLALNLFIWLRSEFYAKSIHYVFMHFILLSFLAFFCSWQQRLNNLPHQSSALFSLKSHVQRQDHIFLFKKTKGGTFYMDAKVQIFSQTLWPKHLGKWAEQLYITLFCHISKLISPTLKWKPTFKYGRFQQELENIF